ncbi:hypothetical protein HXX76_006062 [Chlamydomonas incerta]|uniref:Uncharacterized protein n=1 Tax=Chlamydomonas incerta TaxID=51695 RepID=A0A835W2Z7_CHLIN|nr:hypothetical protein HXX76_006062 [Chlamydomonas incerta]|eukprot:KAG2437410.1 hypothetical protein HXX76_006062 [Chlamydomonas incerta]
MTLRLVDRATASMFSKPRHKTIDLAVPCPQHAYSKSWCAPRSLQNKPWGPRAFEQAVRWGNVARCKWLVSQHCGHDPGTSLEIAAELGHMGVAEYLVSRMHMCPPNPPVIAARNGHSPLALWLLKRCSPRPTETEDLLVAAAWGCVLRALVWLVARVDVDGLESAAKTKIVAAAANSRTPDAHAKAEWLRAELSM